MRFSVAVG